MYETYRTWCSENGRKPLAATSVYDKLRSRVADATRRGGRGFRCGKSEGW